jgi:hypothetical protein
MNIQLLIETVTKALTRQMGGKVTVTLDGDTLRFKIDCGDRIGAVGGFAGGVTIGYIEKGRMFPKMITGLNPFGGNWYKVLDPAGWFDTN